MKELSIEEKAQRYDEVVNKLRRFMRQGIEPLITRADVQDFFPEIIDAEDEKIRKTLINMFKGYNIQKVGDFTDKEIIDWLETQGGQKQEPCENCKNMCLNCHNFPCVKKRAFEQGKSVWEVINEGKVDNQNCVKPTDKVEPKFKVGDWVTNGDYTWKIVEVKPLDYILQSQDGNIVDDTISHVDEQFHSFTIEDAKDGDVLADILAGSEDDVVLIFRGIGNAKWNDVIDYHCYYNCYRKEFIVQEGLGFWGHVDDTELKPATKEQRDLLFAKMHEVGYMWDAEKKESKKIEQKFAEWSEEDENFFNDIIGFFENEKNALDCCKWLKSLKERYIGLLEQLKKL